MKREIKSKRAKELVETSHKHSNVAAIFKCYEDAIILAEQDAEERAVKAFKLVFKGFVADGLAEQIAEVDFRNLLNNGGQSNE